MDRKTAPPGARTSPLARRVLRWVALLCIVLAGLVISGVILADRLAPRASGAPGYSLPVEDGRSAIDREIQPLLASHPARTGVLVVNDGVDAFAARAIAARRAGRSLDLQYYMWHDDLTGRLLAREVYAAAERGVRVRMLLDDMNAQGLDPQLMALDAHPNIEIRLYNPFRRREGIRRVVETVQRAFSVTHRMHNKAWIADGRVAIVGGRNIGDEYFAAARDVNFHDLDLVLFGPAVADASRIFDAFWNSSAVVPVSKLNEKGSAALRELMREADDRAATTDAAPFLARVARSARAGAYQNRVLVPLWSAGVRVISDPPVKTADNRDRWLVTSLMRTLRSARHKALIVSPYFVPGDTGAALLTGLAHRGLFVGIATNSLAANDVPAVHAGYSAYRLGLLDGGVRLYEIKPNGRRASTQASTGRSSLHTKALVVDDRVGFVGSFNLDPRSVNLNTEMGVVFDDTGIGRKVRDEFVELAGPATSYWVYRSGSRLRWLDRASAMPQVFDAEPRTSVIKRAQVRLIGWLPLESQL